MAYASGEKRSGAPSLGGPGPPASGTNIGASGPSPPSQPRKSSGSRPVLSARPTTASNAGPTASGPLVASMLGGSYPYHNRTASPAPQRNVSSPQHPSSQRSTSASLQRTSSSRQRSSHGQLPGKPFFAAYGLQYSGNGRSGSGMGSSTSRTSGTMSPYRNRPSSSTGPPSTGGAPPGVASVPGRPSTSQATQRAAGENWFGNTKLSVTLPNEAARVVQELGQLLSVFAPPAPSTGPPGPKAPGSFRASKYVSGSVNNSTSGIGAAAAAAAASAGSNAHKEAWGSSGAGGSGDMMLSANGSSALMRPTSAASSTGSASKPVMAQFVGDGRHTHGQGANLSLMRLQQQQQPAVYGSVSGAAGMLAAAPGSGSQPSPSHSHTQQHYQQPSYAPGGPGQMHGGAYLPSAFLNYQSSSANGSSSPSQPPPPPRLNMGMVGSAVTMASSLPEPAGGSSSQVTSPTSSPHGIPSLQPYPQPLQFSQTYPHSVPGPTRFWEGPSPGAASAPPMPSAAVYPPSHGYMTGQTPAYAGAVPAASQVTTPQRTNSGGSGSAAAAVQYHYLPFVDGQSGSGSAAAAAAAAPASTGASHGYTTMTVASSPGAAAVSYGQALGLHGSPSPSTATYAATASPSLLTSAGAVAALGTHPPPPPLPVPTALGPVPHAPSSSLAPASHSAPLHFAIPPSAGATIGAGGVLYSPAGKSVRDSLLGMTNSGNSSSGNISNPSPSTSASQVQPLPGSGATGMAGFAGASPFSTFPGAAAAVAATPPLSSFRSSALANAPHPMGLPPPSPLKIVPPTGSAPGSGRGAFIRSSSSRSSNGSGSGCDNGLYYNGTLLPTVQDVEREDVAAAGGDFGGGGNGAAGQPPPQTPMRPTYGSGSEDGAVVSSAAPGTGYGGGAQASGAAGGGGGGAHVTWAASVTHGSSAPGTPTRMYNTSYSDLAARRVSASQMGMFDSTSSSPFARGSENYSRALMEHGTLTCVRPSTVPSNFAADSQPDLGNYGELQGSGDQVSGGEAPASGGASASVSASMASPTWTPGGGGVATASSLAAATAASSAHQPWRRSTENVEQAAVATAAAAPGSAAASAALQHQQTSSSTTAQEQYQQQHRGDMASVYSGASAVMSSAFATAREDGVWGRSRDSTPVRLPHGHSSATAPTASSQQQQQQQQQQQYPQQQYAQHQSPQQQYSLRLSQQYADALRQSAISADATVTTTMAPPATAATSTSTIPPQGYSAAAAPATTTSSAAGTGTSVPVSTATSAFASPSAMRQIDMSPAVGAYSAGVGGTSAVRQAENVTVTSSNLASATATTNSHSSAPPTAVSPSAPPAAAAMTPPAAAVASSMSAGVPGDQSARPRSVIPQPSPRNSPWADASTARVQSTATTAPAQSTPTTSAAAGTTNSSGHTTGAPAAATTTTPAATMAASVTTPAAAVPAPAAAASSSPAASSAAGSAVSSGSTSSGTASSSAGYGSGSASASAAGTSSSSSSAASAAVAAAAAAGLQQHSSSRRSGSIVGARFNPATVLGSEPDATFGNLLPGYSVGKVIGEGGFCQVRLAVHHLSQRKVAVKVIDRSKLSDPNEAKRMQREIRVMKHLSHQCVIKLFEVVESPRHLFLVMEHAPAGSLLDYVRARKRLPEADACVFFQQIVSSLEYCHSREVVHRDIKLENILLDTDQRMKLIDFGLSAFFVPGKRLRVHCGSPSYAAPEIVARKAYEGPPVDVWSLGVVLFAMVAGYLPFHASGGNKQELCNKIIAGQYTAPDWLSSSMKDLLSKMLTTDPEKRITFPQVWQHSWVRNGPQWRERGVNCYEVAPDPAAPGGVRCDEQIVAELEVSGYTRSALVQHLIAGDANHITASYFLLCEAKADALRRMRGSTPRGGGSSSSRNSSSAAAAGASSSRSSTVASSSTTATTAAAFAASSQLASAVAKVRAAESPGRGSSTSRPSTAAGGGGSGGSGGYASARGHRTPHAAHQGEELGMNAGTGRMAVAV